MKKPKKHWKQMEVGMKHKWEKLANDGDGNKQWKCKTCGCLKVLGNYKFAQPDYERSGQMYSEYVECIDWELENSKTID